jgi:hypothetical protein
MIESENESQAHINAIHKVLEECAQKNILDFTISYEEISKAFPSGDHQTYRDLKAINFKALTIWANANGWNVKFDHENCDPGHPPDIRFTKIGYVPSE